MFDAQLIGYTLAVALLTITPGADTLLVMRNVLARGRKAGILATLGVSSGLFIHALLSGLGLSLILTRSALAFSVVKWAGALYLCYLGVQSLRSALKPNLVTNEISSTAEPSLNPWHAYREGLITNVLNPKVALFYLAFLPQFIRPNDPVMLRSLLLTSIHFVLGIVWLGLITLSLDKMRSWMLKPRVRAWIEGSTGLILFGFGIRLALSKR
ncbi:MAG TPA: LysE family translocator [Herpetosiphon sp.]|uniref:Lysine exporter protein (LYSE/YGGA) n=1 Tax=Herpetosiphon aurantiacus (strain ATCC 23779 / DSM 785 / 114-95) TaxID=316274 RepID=A9B091_HERA2|nr:LysE family translocator [Herpetosiphon sp.]ABX05200.1 Lysine exporter protein (LYSE/YGGA) [Herpetosiphon aurantiacus DSM 785]HBW51289.1 LysE family translocator [Herpetosiphon sp.]